MTGTTSTAADRGVDRIDDLEQEIDALRDELAMVASRDLPLLKGTVRTMLNGDIDTIDDLPDAAAVFARRLEALEEQVATVTQCVNAFDEIAAEHSTKEQKMAAVLAFAENKRDPDQSTIAVTAPEIKGCVGVSRRYAYDLLEAMVDEIDGVDLREETRVRTGTGVKTKKKAILVDCERVHDTTEPVNSFTTGGDGSPVDQGGQ